MKINYNTYCSLANIDVEDQAAEVILAAFRTANGNPKGSAVVSIPMDVAGGKSKITAFPSSAFIPPLYGHAPMKYVQTVARMIENAKRPVFFLGQRASSAVVVDAVRQFLKAHPLPVVETFQAAGAIPEDLADRVFFGRVGLFRNQTGDKLLSKADLVICLGYDPTEYDASAWNPNSGTQHIIVPFSFGFTICMLTFQPSRSPNRSR
jgi:acetolactate synthase-1/2/3 large subunit